MLAELRIRNLAVIEDVRVPFAPGLNVLTGETGAGKSIVIDALLLVAGARAQADLIRSGAEAAAVEALFEVHRGDPAWGVLEEAGHPAADGQVLIRREVGRAGRSRAFVNDSAATVGLLDRLGEALLEVHGQHEHQRLLEPAAQLAVLDRFAGCQALRDAVGEAYRRWEAARQERERLLAEAREAMRQEDLYRFQLSEIDAVRPEEGEEEALRAERRRLQHAERIALGLRQVTDLLYDEPASAADRVDRAAALIRELSGLDPALAAPGDDLQAARAHLEEAVARARALRDRAVLDPERLEAIDHRLDALTRLRRKYGETLAAVLAYRGEIAGALERLGRHEELAAALEARLAALAGEAAEQAARLGAAREAGARSLERWLQREVRALGMEHARVRVELRREPAGPGELATGPAGWRVARSGAETAEFLLSANPGEDLRPLAKVVSGGELSRTMLAIKALLAAREPAATLVFDEVDAGIWGRVAAVVWEKLAQAAAGRQVLCVTHLAQIAAHADHHLRVAKHVTRGATRTAVAALDAAGRVEELARMLGGERVTEATRRHARDLLGQARRRGERA